MRRANNICIGLSRFHRAGLKNHDIFQAVLDMDSLSCDDLLTLNGILPSDEEIEDAKFYQRNPPQPQLAPAESFLVEVIQHPQFSSQVIAFLFSIQGLVDLDDIQAKLYRLSSITSLLTTDASFKMLLQTIGELGNKANFESDGAYIRSIALNLDGLARLSDIHSADGNWNLMSFLVEMIKTQSPNLLDLADRFQDISSVCKYDVIGISQTLNSIKSSMSHLKTIKFNHQFESKLAPHLEAIRVAIHYCSLKFREFVLEWRNAILYFGEELESYNEPSLGFTTTRKTGMRPPIYLYTSLNQFFEGYSKYANQLLKSQTEQNESYNRHQRKIVVNKEEPEQEEDLIVTFEQLKEMAKRNQELEYEEAAQLFKRVSMMPRADESDTEEESEGDFNLDDYE